jgi:hypothetical protein
LLCCGQTRPGSIHDLTQVRQVGLLDCLCAAILAASGCSRARRSSSPRRSRTRIPTTGNLLGRMPRSGTEHFRPRGEGA